MNIPIGPLYHHFLLGWPPWSRHGAIWSSCPSSRSPMPSGSYWDLANLRVRNHDNWTGLVSTDVNGCQWMSMVRYHQTWLGNPELNRGWVRWENHRTLAGGFSRHGADYRRVVSMNFDMWQIWLMVNDLICWWLISRGILNKKHLFWFLICANSSSVFDKNDGLGFGPLFAASCFHSSE